MKKICTNCNVEKESEEYRNDKQKKDGLYPRCKSCCKTWNKQYRLENRDRLVLKRKEYNLINKEKIANNLKEYKKAYYAIEENKQHLKKYYKEYNKKNREKKFIQSQFYRAKNKEKIFLTKKRYREINKEKLIKARKEYYQKNKNTIIEKVRIYSTGNRKKISARRRIWKSKRLITHPLYRLRERMSCSVRKSLKILNIEKCKAGWQSLVGYTAEQLKLHLEQRFTPEMSWENYGSYWHIDHIEPQSWFKYDSMDHPAFKACWALDNLQPLEAKANMSKSNRWKG